MNIAIVGLGKFGKELTKNLAKDNHNIIVIDSKEQMVSSCVDEYDVKGYVGNGASCNTLIEAEVTDFDLLIAVTSSDEVNILSCLISKKIGIKHTVARVRNPEYGNQFSLMMNELGIDLTINPDLDTAREIHRILRFPSALKVETFGNDTVDLVEYKIDKDSPLSNNTLIEIQEKYGIRMLICIVERDGNAFIPKGDFILKENDHIYITSNNETLEKAFKKLDLLKSKPSSNIIIGGGRISHYLASLLSDSGMSVKVIEKDKDVAKKFGETNPEALVLNADGTNQQLLLEEGLEKNSIVTLTGADETNIVISSYAKSVNAKKVITKVSNSDYSSLLDTIGLDSTISPKEVFSTSVIRYIRTLENNRSSECKSLYRLVDDKVEALEFVINQDTDYTNIPLKNMKFKNEYIIAAIIRNEEVVIPGGNDVLQKNDSVIIVTTRTNTKDLSEMLG